MMSYQIGQVVPIGRIRKLWIDSAWRPGWFLFNVPPQGELTAACFLSRHGVIDTFHPTQMRYVRNRFKPGNRIPKISPIVPGYLFAFLHRQPEWDALFDVADGKLRSVLCRNGIPIMIPERDMMGMHQLAKAVEAMRAAAIEAAKLRPGDMVEITDGPMTGWTVEVASISARTARLIIPLLGKEPEIDLGKLRKVTILGMSD